MSRAFVRDDDDHPEAPIARQRPKLPFGARNYITAAGAQRLRDELQKLVEQERPPLLARTDDPDAKRRFLAVNQRIAELEESLQSSEVGPPAPEGTDVVRFGATVTVRDRAGEELTYRIVGIDEAAFDPDAVSWLSPVARALTGARLGERVRFRFPSGEDELTIVSVKYF